MLDLLLRRRVLFWLLSGMLALLAVAYLAKGFHEFFSPDPMVGAVDVQRRWIEDRYVLFLHQNPFDVAYANDPPLAKYRPAGQIVVTRNSAVDPKLGVPEGVVYPPWTYPLSGLFLWVPWSILRPWYVGVMAVCLLVISAAVWAMSRRDSPSADPLIAKRYATLMTLLALGLSSWPFAIYGGNFPTVVVASLAGAWWLDHHRKHVPAGLLLAMAMIKPSVGAPFFLAFLIKRRWSTAGTCLVLLAFATGVTWYFTATNPAEMFRQMGGAASRWVGNAAGPIQTMMGWGVSRSTAIRIAIWVGGGSGLVAMLCCARQSMLVMFALAGVTARFWSYHYNYDDNCLVFFLLAWGAVAMSGTDGPLKGFLRPGGWFANLMFALIAISMLIPERMIDPAPIFWSQQVLWLMGAIALVCISRQNRTAGYPPAVLTKHGVSGE